MVYNKEPITYRGLKAIRHFSPVPNAQYQGKSDPREEYIWFEFMKNQRRVVGVARLFYMRTGASHYQGSPQDAVKFFEKQAQITYPYMWLTSVVLKIDKMLIISGLEDNHWFENYDEAQVDYIKRLDDLVEKLKAIKIEGWL